MWLHSLKVLQLLRSAACLHTNQSRSYLNHLVRCVCTNLDDGNLLQRIVRRTGFRTVCEYRSASGWPNLAARMFLFVFVLLGFFTQNIFLSVVFPPSATITVFCMLIPSHKSPVVRDSAAQTADNKTSSAGPRL